MDSEKELKQLHRQSYPTGTKTKLRGAMII